MVGQDIGMYSMYIMGYMYMYFTPGIWRNTRDAYTGEQPEIIHDNTEEQGKRHQCKGLLK